MKRLEPVFPTGTEQFCMLKAGYPGVPAPISVVTRTRDAVCKLKRQLQPFPWAQQNWDELCLLKNIPLDVFDRQWPGLQGYLHHLLGIDISATGYSGSLPEAVSDLHRLVELDVSKNNLNGMLRLKSVCAGGIGKETSGMPLAGSLPMALCAMTRLRRLTIRYTHVSGPIPSCISSLVQLTHLDLSRNGFRGSGGLNGMNSHSASFRVAASVSSLYLRGAGTLPETMIALTNLVHLDVSFNALAITSSVPGMKSWLDGIEKAVVAPNLEVDEPLKHFA